MKDKWKLLQSGSRLKSQQSFDQRCKSFRYTPKKNSRQTEFYKNFKILNESINNQNQIKSPVRRNCSILSSESIESFEKRFKRGQSMNKSEKDFGFALMQCKFEQKRRNLRKKTDNLKEKKMQVQVERELSKLHNQFEKFKKFILLQLSKHKKMLEQFTSQILENSNYKNNCKVIENQEAKIKIQDFTSSLQFEKNTLISNYEKQSQMNQEGKVSLFIDKNGMSYHSGQLSHRLKQINNPEKSKREFNKLFDALKCLKKDLVSLSDFKNNPEKEKSKEKNTIIKIKKQNNRHFKMQQLK